MFVLFQKTSVWWTTTVPCQRLVWLKNVLTLASPPTVAEMPNARSSLTKPSAFAQEACRATPWLHVWKSAADPTTTVQTMKNVTTSTGYWANGSVSHFVGGAPAPKMPSVEQQDTKKFVNASLLTKEMVTHNATNVSNFLISSGVLRPFFKQSIFTPLIARQPDPEPECRIDEDCPRDHACIGAQCQNPCTLNNPCSRSQRCVVENSLPIRTVACVCPNGFVQGTGGDCVKGIKKFTRSQRAYKRIEQTNPD